MGAKSSEITTAPTTPAAPQAEPTRGAAHAPQLRASHTAPLRLRITAIMLLIQTSFLPSFLPGWLPASLSCLVPMPAFLLIY